MDTIINGFKPADVNTKDEKGYTPLHYACRDGHLDLVRLLLEARADVEARNKDNETPLHQACLHGHPATARLLLLDHGANVQTWSSNNSTPIHLACLYGHTPTARLLLEKGGDVRSWDMFDSTSLQVAMYLPPGDTRDEIIDLSREYAPEVVMEAYCSQSPGGMQ